MKSLRNILGAFGDAAILFPILVLLSARAQVPMGSLLAYTGLLYIFSAMFYRLPMPVQPLKSIAMAAVAIGASFTEIRLASLGLGVFCLSLLLMGTQLECVLKKVPLILIHQLQVGLGVLLLVQAQKAFGGGSLWTLETLFIVLLVLALLIKPEWRGVPILGVVATGAFVWGVFKGNAGGLSSLPLVSSGISENTPIHWNLILGLVLPQMALTLSNSVLSTKIICDQLYPEQSGRVTHRRLLSVIGIGNILMAWWGGLPFCHGSGGLTAHHKAGANHWISTALMGLVLIGLSFGLGSGGVVIPRFLIVVLLSTVGVFHMKLAQANWNDLSGRWYLVTSVIVVVLTQNLLWVIPAYCILDGLRRLEARYGFLR